MTYEDRPVSVTNPGYDRSHPSGVECIDTIRHLPFNVGNAIKYLWRAGDKVGPEKLREDLEKALWYIQDAIDNPRASTYSELVDYGLLAKWNRVESKTQRGRIIVLTIFGFVELAKQELEAWLDSIPKPSNDIDQE